MSYKFNDVLVKKSADKTVLMAEKMPRCINYYATKKAQKCLIWLTMKYDIDINGDISNLSNVAVGKLIDTIDKHKGEKIVIKIMNCGTMNIDDGELVTQEKTTHEEAKGKYEYAEFFAKNNA